jgi:hypothetical protein
VQNHPWLLPWYSSSWALVLCTKPSLAPSDFLLLFLNIGALQETFLSAPFSGSCLAAPLETHLLIHQVHVLVGYFTSIPFAKYLINLLSIPLTYSADCYFFSPLLCSNLSFFVLIPYILSLRYSGSLSI